MGARYEACRGRGCDRQRVAQSVFCDAHHREQLLRAGLLVEREPNPAADRARVVKRWTNVISFGGLTTDELCGNLFDRFILAERHGLAAHMDACLDLVPRDVVSALLRYAEAHPNPFAFNYGPPGSLPRVRDELAAEAARIDLIGRLRARLNG